MISSYGSLDKEISTRISKVSQALGWLRARVLKHHIKLPTRLKVYMDVKHGSCTGNTSASLRNAHALSTVHHGNLLAKQGDQRGSAGPIWLHKHRSNNDKGPASMDRPCDPDGWIPHASWTPVQNSVTGSKNPKKRFKGCIKDHQEPALLAPKDLETCASDRTGWHTTTRKAVSIFKGN